MTLEFVSALVNDPSLSPLVDPAPIAKAISYLPFIMLRSALHGQPPLREALNLGLTATASSYVVTLGMVTYVVPALRASRGARAACVVAFVVYAAYLAVVRAHRLLAPRAPLRAAA